MTTDSMPLESLASAPRRQQDLADWVDSRLTGLLMGTGMPSLMAAFLVMPVLVIAMWGEVHTPSLVAWALTMTVFLLHRLHMFRYYQRECDREGVQARVAFLRRYAWNWGAAGVLWALPVALVFRQAQMDTQFIVGVMVMGHSMVSLMAFSVQLRVFRLYAICLIGTVAISLMLPQLMGHAQLLDPKLLAILYNLLAVFWWLLMLAGQRMHEVHRANFELQHSNEQLIASLQVQTREALRAVATKNRFLSSTAHDLRQPVHALSLYAGWLSAEPEMAIEIAPKIVDSTRAVNQLFDTLFDLTRIDAGNYKVQWQSVDIHALFQDLVLQFEDSAKTKGLVLRQRSVPARVWSDSLVLSRILGNFLSNAIRHTSAGGVLLAVRRRQQFWCFEVWDTGVGIAPEHQSPIFEEFYRVNLHQGTEDSLGLGLTIVSRLSAMMGYELSLASVPGRGSVFRLMVPVTPPLLSR
jgi:signal transduction histidine kinase